MHIEISSFLVNIHTRLLKRCEFRHVFLADALIVCFQSVESVENTSSNSLGSSDLNSCPYGPESDVNEHHRVAYAALDAIQERKISERISVTC